MWGVVPALRTSKMLLTSLHDRVGPLSDVKWGREVPGGDGAFRFWPFTLDGRRVGGRGGAGRNS